MDLFKYLTISTNYQIISLAISVLVIFVAISVLFYYYTNSIKASLLTLISILFTVIITIAATIAGYELLKIAPSEKHLLIIYSSLFITSLNLGLLMHKYSKEVLRKDFDIDHVTRYHFRSTLNMFIILFLSTGAVVSVISYDLLYTVVGIMLISSLSIWFNHLLSRLFFKDKK